MRHCTFILSMLASILSWFTVRRAWAMLLEGWSFEDILGDATLQGRMEDDWMRRKKQIKNANMFLVRMHWCKRPIKSSFVFSSCTSIEMMIPIIGTECVSGVHHKLLNDLTLCSACNVLYTNSSIAHRQAKHPHFLWNMQILFCQCILAAKVCELHTLCYLRQLMKIRICMMCVFAPKATKSSEFFW